MIKEAIKFLIELGIKPDERVVDIVDNDGKDRTFIIQDDGGAWRNEAIANVRDYLASELKDEIENGKITIIA